MKAVLKYPVKVTDEQFIEMPKGAEILTVQTQFGKPQMWALVDKDEERKEMRAIAIVGTGHEHEDSFWEGMAYICTFQMLEGGLIWHVFERRALTK